jgi:hypothetical protein
MTPIDERGARSRMMAALALVLALCAISQGVAAREKMELGWLERIRLQPWDIVLKAKLDTGAKSAAIHATDIERFDKDGKTWVRFKLWLNHRDAGSETITVERPLARDIKIKLRGTDKTQSRPSVKMEFCLGGKRFQALFTLTNRERFNYPVLLGRRFLTDIAVIDPAARYNTDPTCPKSQSE